MEGGREWKEPYGLWDAGNDEHAASSPDCPPAYTVCSLRLQLYPDAPGMCSGSESLWLKGWFDGSRSLVAATLEISCIRRWVSSGA